MRPALQHSPDPKLPVHPSSIRGPTTPWSRWHEFAFLMACLAGATIASIALGQDANWDLQNYHYYNPWAWRNGRIFTWDVAAAQLQT